MVPDEATLLTGKSQLGASVSSRLSASQVVHVPFPCHSSQSCSVPQTEVFSFYTGGTSLLHSYCEWWSWEEPCSVHSKSSSKQKLEATDLLGETLAETTCPGQTIKVPIITICRRYVILQQDVLVRNAELISYCYLFLLGKVKRREGMPVHTYY